MTSKILLLLFLLILSYNSNAQTWIKSGYWYYLSQFPVSDINSTLFTHLLCAHAQINSSTYQLTIPSSNEQDFFTFTDTVKQNNPSVITILSIGGGWENYTVFTSMISQSSRRKSFIESSIKMARLYGFYGLDLWGYGRTSSDMTNTATLLDEWRAAVTTEPRKSNESQLVLTMAVPYSPTLDTFSYPIDSMRRNLDWVNVDPMDYYAPSRSNFTRAHAPLYDPSSTMLNNDYGIREWIGKGFPASKLVLGMPYYGYAWKLANPSKNASIGAPAIGPALTVDGIIGYKDIKGYIQQYGVASVYNETYVVNYCTFESTWIGFDDVEAITAKVSYAKKKGLLGYYAWEISEDDNWVLSLAASNGLQKNRNRTRLLLIILLTIALAVLLLAFIMIYLRRKVIKSKGVMDPTKESFSKLRSNGENNSDGLQVFSFASIEAATNNFSIENKLGEGGFGPVYKGELWNGEAIAVKRLSRTSRQGLEEFKTEVTLTARLQHVNLVRLLGFCTHREEKLLIYEYMPNKSLDFYLFDPNRALDWSKRIQIIEGVTQGLLYLQEYSRLTVLHRDLKASNILLDKEMKPKISDFGMAKIFEKDEDETNKEQTKRIVGTYGYVPPECVKEGIYSMKSDVYSFGVLLLQIISGKKCKCLYGIEGSLNLLEYAYVIWKDGRFMEFMDPSLDDTSSSCKLVRCMQVALLCVQEKPEDRPSMLEVSSMLKNETTAIAIPKKPAFSTRKYEDEENGYKSQYETCSINDASISEMEPR